MKNITIKLTDDEYLVLERLSTLDPLGKLPVRSIERANKLWTSAESLYFKGLIILHIVSSESANIWISPAGAFVSQFAKRTA